MFLYNGRLRPFAMPCSLLLRVSAGKFIAFLRASLSLSRVQSLLLCQTLGWRQGLKYPITLINLATATWLPKLVPLISHDIIC